MHVWGADGESMRVDQDLDTYNGRTFTGLAAVQRTVENYRQFITLQAAKNRPMTIHPDLDNLFLGNPERVTENGDEPLDWILRQFAPWF